jgi:hypothetical protein
MTGQLLSCSMSPRITLRVMNRPADPRIREKWKVSIILTPGHVDTEGICW